MRCRKVQCQHLDAHHVPGGCILTGCLCKGYLAPDASDELAPAPQARGQRCFVQASAISENQKAKRTVAGAINIEDSNGIRQVFGLELVLPDGEVVARFVTSERRGDSPCIWIESVGRGRWREAK